MANERTFLAWMRTALALLATGVAIETLVPAEAGMARSLIAAVFVGLAGVLAAGAFLRWMGTERALRLGRALPTPGLAVLVTVGIVVLALLVLVSLVLS